MADKNYDENYQILTSLQITIIIIAGSVAFCPKLHRAGALALFSLVVLVLVLVVLSRFSRNLSIGERRALAYSVLYFTLMQHAVKPLNTQ